MKEPKHGAGGTADMKEIKVPANPVTHVAHDIGAQPDAPNVYRFNCPGCKETISLYGRAGSWFVKLLGK